MNLTTETKRQWVHISMLLFALLFRFIDAPWAFLCAMTAFIHNILLLPKYAPHLFRSKESLLQGIAVYPLLVAILVVLFPERIELAGGAWAILAFGDGFSTLFGRQKPLVPIPWNPDKSLGGFLAFVIMASIGAFLIMSWIDDVQTPLHLLMISVCAAFVAGVFETLPLPWDDNVLVALSSAITLALVWDVDLSLTAAAISAGWLGSALLINMCVAGLAWWRGLVSVTGALSGMVVGTAILIMGGIDFYFLLLLFFIGASAATRYGYYEKTILGSAQEEGGRRGAKHALANCILASLAAVLFGMTDGADHLLAVFYCAALATAFSDTISSELGQIYGKNPFLPTSFRLVSPGTVGAVTIEGTLCGMGASVFFAIIAFAFSTVPANVIPAIILGGWLGSYAESYIGGFWTDEGAEVNNEWMNVLNTFLGGMFALFVATITNSI